MKLLPRLMAMSLLTVMVATQAAQAGEPADAARHARHAGAHGMHGDGMFKALARVKAELKLSPAQSGLWEEADAATRDARQAMRQNHEQMRAAMQAERQKDVLDLAKLDQAMSSQHEQARQGREAVKSKWLAVYASLSVDQKRVVSQHIKDRFARMEKWHERRRAQKAQ
ncbi:Spy/CpxP family protein refolding chaperone [Chitinimonas arctica]|nr:Spy/CpxP family protein refolding chaperone [Chitinimonas arctica]